MKNKLIIETKIPEGCAVLADKRVLDIKNHYLDRATIHTLFDAIDYIARSCYLQGALDRDEIDISKISAQKEKKATVNVIINDERCEYLIEDRAKTYKQLVSGTFKELHDNYKITYSFTTDTHRKFTGELFANESLSLQEGMIITISEVEK